MSHCREASSQLDKFNYWSGFVAIGYTVFWFIIHLRG